MLMACPPSNSLTVLQAKAGQLLLNITFSKSAAEESIKWRDRLPCNHTLQALLAFSSRREALTPIGAVEVLGDFDLAAGPHV